MKKRKLVSANQIHGDAFKGYVFCVFCQRNCQLLDMDKKTDSFISTILPQFMQKRESEKV